MNPQSNDQIGHQLPTPIEQQAPAQASQNMPMPGINATPNVAANTMPQAPLNVPLPPLPAAPQMAQNAQAVTPSTTISDVPSTANDTDLIEKEWVTKAKSIVNNTQDDPYSQSKKLTEIKADYLQKRYNKNLKLSE